jgi:hypothetical protein
MGFSTGNLPAMDMAWYINTTYKDARYAINRVSLLDAVCTHLGFRVTPFNSNRVAGEQCWVDNYISNDPNYSAQTIINGAFNVVCRPPRNHSYPVNRYSSSSLEYEKRRHDSIWISVTHRSRKNLPIELRHRISTTFVINSTEAGYVFNESQYPGKSTAPCSAHRTMPMARLYTTNGVEIGCEIVENSRSIYSFCWAPMQNRVMDYEVVSDTTNPPKQTVSSLPNQHNLVDRSCL